MAVNSIFYFYTVANMFTYPIKNLIGSAGCYVIDFAEHFGVILLQSSSFYTSLFRYLCIAHQGFLLKHGLSPMVKNNLPYCDQDNKDKLFALTESGQADSWSSVFCSSIVICHCSIHWNPESWEWQVPAHLSWKIRRLV